MKEKFKSIYLELTDQCGLTCPFCPSKDLVKKGHVNKDLIISRLEKIKGYSEQVYLHILGDPLLYPDLQDVFEYTKNNNIKTAITTNALFLNKLTDIPANLKKVNISLQSLITSKDINNRLDIIKEFLKNRPLSLGISLRLWNNKDSETISKFNATIKTELDSFLETINSKNITWSFEDEFKWPSLNDEINEIQSSCLGGKLQLGILSNGDITLCCLDYEGKTKLGNIDDSSLEDVLNSELFENVLKGWNNRKPYMELCQKCTFRNRFKK